MMLKALMLRQVMMEDSNRKNFAATAEEREVVEQKFKTHMGDVVEFVNGPEGNFLRENLQA